MTTSVYRLSIVLMTVVSVAACSPKDNADNPQPNSVVASAGPLDVKTLAERYLYEQADDEKQNLLKMDIRSLSPPNSRAFVNAVLNLQPKEEVEQYRILYQNIMNYAEQTGKHWMDLTEDDFNKIVTRTSISPPSSEDLTGCPIGRVSCNQVSYSGSVPHVVASSPCAGCIAGYAADRYSNDSCEGVACDFRLKFAGAAGKTRISGNTLAAVCALDYYHNLETRVSGSERQVGLGIGGPILCLLLPTDTTGTYLAYYSLMY